MILVELALQGVRGFPDVVRVPLDAGVNVAHGVDAERRRALLDVVYHCLYPDSARADATAELAAPGAAESRVALTFFGRDKTTYRLVRDVVNGSMKLYRFEPEAKKYRLFTDVASDAAQYVRVQQHLPDEVTYERLFVFSADSMPSRGRDARTRSGVGPVREPPAPSGPGLPTARFVSGSMGRPSSFVGGMPNALEGGAGFNPTNALVQSEMAAEQDTAWTGTTEEKKALLTMLRANLEAVERGNRAQAEIDALAARKFDISERHASVEGLRQRRAELERARSEDHALDNMPPNLGDRLRSFEAREARFRADEDKIRDEILRVEQEAEGDLVLPLRNDRYFLGALVVAAVAFVLALALERPYVAVLNVPAAMVALAAALRYVSDLERVARRGSRLAAIEERLDRLNKQRDLDTGVTRRLLDRLNMDSPSELLAEVERFEARNAEIDRLAEEIARAEADPHTVSELRELEQIDARVVLLEQEVAAAAGATEGVEALRRKVESLERHLGPDVPPRIKSPPLGLAAQDRPRPPSPPRPTGPEASSPDLSEDLVAQSAFSSHVSPQSPLASSEHRILRGTGELPPSRLRGSSGIFPPPPRGSSGLGITGDLGAPAASESSDLPAFPGPADSGRGRSPTAPSGLPSFPSPSGPGRPAAASGPVVPPGQSPFDFGGGLIGDDDEDDDDPKGGGGRPGGSGQQASGYLAMGSGLSGFGGGGGIGSYGGGGDGLPPDRSRELVQATTDLLSVEVDKLATKLAPRLGQYLEAFTAGALKRAEIGPRGEVRVLSEAGEGQAFTELEGDTLDAVDAALRFTLAELVLRRYRMPLLVEEPFTNLDPKRRKLLTQMLGYFGRATQVIVLSEQTDLPGRALELG